MRTEAKFLIGLGAFFGLMGVVYWFWSKENAGSVMIFVRHGAVLPAR